jgi:hypothetical protein
MKDAIPLTQETLQVNALRWRWVSLFGLALSSLLLWLTPTNDYWSWFTGIPLLLSIVITIGYFMR